MATYNKNTATGNPASGLTYRDEVYAVFQNFPSALEDGEKEAIDDFVSSQVVSGNWALIDDFAHQGMQLSANSLKSWKQGKTAVLTGSPTFTPGTGYTYSSGKYLTTNFNLSSDTTQYALNDCGIDVFVGVNNEPAGGYDIYFGNDGTNAVRLTRLNGGDRRVRLNGATNVNSLILTGWGTGLISLYRKNSSAQVTYAIQGTEIESLSANSSAKPNTSLVLNGGSFTFDGGLSSWCVRKYTGFDLANFRSNLLTLNSALAAV